MVSKEVLTFLEEHNRPFSVNEIHQGLKEAFGKAAVQKALDVLVENEKVKEKVYGKQKVYCIVQKNEASSADMRESLLEMDRKINETTLQLKEITDKLKSSSSAVAEMKGKITLEEAIDQKLRLEKEIEDIKKQLEKYSDTEAMCPQKKLDAEKEYEKFLSEYKKRKRMCMDVVNSILENYPKSKKALFEDIGIETDEEVGFSLDKS